VRVREDVRIRLACPTSSVVTMVTTGMKLQLSLFLLWLISLILNLVYFLM